MQMNNMLAWALVLEAVGIVLLVAEVFLPSHGTLTVLALGSLAGGLYAAFQYSVTFGFASLVAAILLLPTFAVLAVRLWPRTAVGRRIAPPNPEVRTGDSPMYPDSVLRGLVGQTGTTLTPLRPVGACTFSNRRVECLAESGMIERGTRVVAIDVQGKSLVVRPA
jgi:membrane-bound ClpP family serine protease